MAHTLLVADDSPTIQRVIQLALSDQNLDVVAVTSGEQAIEEIESRSPDLVLADTRMPDRSGYEIAEFLNSRPAHQGIPVVLMTGAFEPLDERRAKAAGCVAVLVKPFEPGKLVSTVRELLGLPAEPARKASPKLEPRLEPRREPRMGEPALTWPVRDDLAAAPTETAAPRDPETDPMIDPAAVPETAPVIAPATDPVTAAEETRTTRPAPAAPAAPARVEPPSPTPSSASSSAPAPPPARVEPAAPRATPSDPTPPSLVITDELVDRLATRVIARLSDRVVRETTTDVVSRVAERLVREEIERLKDKLRQA